MDIYITSSVYRDLGQVIKFANGNNLNIEISRFGSMVGLNAEFDDRLEFHKKIFKEFQNKLSVHGFFFDLNPSTPDPEMLKVTEHRYNQSFKIARGLGAKTVVFHSGYNSLIKHPDYNRDFLDYQIAFWDRFIHRFEDEGITVAIENTYEFTPDILLKLVDAVNSNNLKLCIDTGHTNINSHVDNVEWINALGDRLHHMHVHNNYGDADSHYCITKGTVDFKKMFGALFEKNLKPNIVLEIFKEDEMLQSLKYIENELKLIETH